MQQSFHGNFLFIKPTFQMRIMPVLEDFILGFFLAVLAGFGKAAHFLSHGRLLQFAIMVP